jgi:hypothetical protein
MVVPGSALPAAPEMVRVLSLVILSVALAPVSCVIVPKEGAFGAAVSIAQVPSEVGKDSLPAESVEVMLKG